MEGPIQSELESDVLAAGTLIEIENGIISNDLDDQQDFSNRGSGEWRVPKGQPQTTAVTVDKAKKDLH